VVIAHDPRSVVGLRLRTVGRPGVGTIPGMSISLPAVRRALVLSVLALLVLAMTASLATAQTDVVDDSDASVDDSGASVDDSDGQVVEVLPLRAGLIDPPVTSQILDVLELAEAQGSQLVVLQYSSPGGVSVDLDEVLGRMEASEVPVAVLVGPLGVGADAAGAAGLLWLAADIRAVSADASVGPLDPVDLAALDGDFPLRQRTTEFVEAAGADAELTERLLDSAVSADELTEAGAVTLAAQGLEPLLVELDGTTVTTAAGETTLRIRAAEVEVRFHSLGLVRRVLHAATTAPFIYLLLVVGLGALLFEVFQPGFGVAGMAGILTVAIAGFGLTVLPVTWWAVSLVVLGLLFYALDTAIAGFGPVTAAATLAFVIGSLQFYASEALALNPWVVGATTVTVFVFFVFVMTTVLRAQAGPEGVAVDDLVGRPGIVRSVLNPEGHVYIDGALWRARWTGDTKRAKVGTPVLVHDVDGAVVLVRALDPATPAAVGDRDGAGVSPDV
jgi:membrane-bound serine protease (ClpP class)